MEIYVVYGATGMVSGAIVFVLRKEFSKKTYHKGEFSLYQAVNLSEDITMMILMTTRICIICARLYSSWSAILNLTLLLKRVISFHCLIQRSLLT